MSRALFNDPQVSKRIADDFIPASGGIERLQPSRYGWHETASSRWFEPMARKAFDAFAPKGWWDQYQTYQGIYVVGPDGTPYAYRVVWELPPAELLKTFDGALEAYKKRPPAKVDIAQKTVESEAPPAPDAGTSVVRVYSRVRAGNGGPHPDYKGIGRDHLWIFGDEVREMLETGALPRKVAARIVRFHLLDNGRNIGKPYDEKDVRQAEFSLKALKRDGALRSFGFEATFAAERDDVEEKEKVGIEGRLEGEFDVDEQKAKIVRFRAYGEAKAWGDVVRTGAPEGKYPLVFAMVDADDVVARSVPPVWHSISPVWTPIYVEAKLAISK